MPRLRRLSEEEVQRAQPILRPPEGQVRQEQGPPLLDVPRQEGHRRAERVPRLYGVGGRVQR